MLAEHGISQHSYPIDCPASTRANGHLDGEEVTVTATVGEWHHWSGTCQETRVTVTGGSCQCQEKQRGVRGSSAVERATPGEEVPGSIPAVAARSLQVGSVSV